MLALRNVTEAQEGVAQLAEKAKLNRESLYRMLSERGNPEFRSLEALSPCAGIPPSRCWEPVTRCWLRAVGGDLYRQLGDPSSTIIRMSGSR